MRAILRCFPLVALMMIYGCGKSESPPAQAAASSAAPPFHTVADIRQLMNWVLDPSADVVWGAVGTIITAEGTENIQPKTDEEWTAVRNGAAVVAESGNLLMLPGRARDQDWMTFARKMIDAANVTLQAAEAKDPEALFTAGSDLYIACSECHAKYLPPAPLN
jgi:hypothetical protein